MALMICREYERHDPGHKGTFVNIVFNNICVFSEYKPPELKGKAVPGFTVFAMNNGQVLLCKVDVSTVQQIFKNAK